MAEYRDIADPLPHTVDAPDGTPVTDPVHAARLAARASRRSLVADLLLFRQVRTTAVLGQPRQEH